nr:hypothetical protein Iba_chr05fCG16830 [Ipomoea batatas]
MFLISGAEEEEERIPLSCSTVCFLRYFTIFIITAFESRGDCFAARPPPSPGSRLLQFHELPHRIPIWCLFWHSVESVAVVIGFAFPKPLLLWFFICFLNNYSKTC